MTSIKLYEGNCLDVLRKCPDNYMDSIVTDPPYGLSFMGKGWDYAVPSAEIWKECLRVLKPGGHLLAFGGTRTYHRLVVNIEDAGFEIRDQIMWIYGSGFPKSMDISKAIDKEAGAEREQGEPKPYTNQNIKSGHLHARHENEREQTFFTQPATDEAKKWSGYGTALKPANEPICLARKPLSEKTVAKNVLKHGVGGLNVDASRITTDEKLTSGRHLSSRTDPDQSFRYESRSEYEQNSAGRFPANVLFDEYAAGVLDEQSGQSQSGGGKSSGKTFHGQTYVKEHNNRPTDSGGASRFFYVAKASKKDRGAGNTHPTVKPIKLMEYLIKLVTPEGGIVLDPFMGSGTTGVAAQNLGFGFRGIEMTPEYYEICKQRILGAGKETA